MPLEDRIHGLAARYVAAPQWVKSVIGTAYAMVPESVRLGPAYGRFSRVFDSAPPHEAYAHLRLQETLVHALRKVPAYRQYAHLAADVAGNPKAVLAQMPLSSKESIKHHLEDFVSESASSQRLRMFTGGSTAIPMTFFLTQGVSRAKEWAVFHSFARRHNTDGKGVVLALRGRTVRTANTLGGRLWSYEPIKRHLILSSDHLESRYMSGYVEAIRQWRPRYIHAFPSALYPLVRWLVEHDQGDLLADIQSVLLSSESVFPHQWQLFAKFFRCPVIATYGHTERVLFAHTLPGDPRYFFWPHYGHLELVDSTGNPVTRPGEPGEIVGTSFDNWVMPFIRYRTGDYAVLSDRDPPPGYEGFPVCERIDGRLQEFVVCRDQRLISVTTLGAAHFEQLDRCTRIQYEQRKKGELVLRVVALGDAKGLDTHGIAAAIEAKTQGGCSVVVEVVNEIQLTSAGKQRLVIQHLDISKYLGASGQEGIQFPVQRSIDRPTRNAVEVQQPSRPSLLPIGSGKAILMVGPSPVMRGGIASVVDTYRSGGVFDDGAIKYVCSQSDTRSWKKPLTFLGALGQVSADLARRRVEGVYAHVASNGSFWRKSAVLALARLFGVKTLFHLHGGGFVDFAEKRSGPVARWWIRHTLRSSAGVIVLSKRWEDWVCRFAPGTVTHVLGNPVATPSCESEVRRTKTVVFVGLICEAKGCFDLLKAFARIRPDFGDWRLVVAGHGEADRFRREVSTAGLWGRVEVRGWIAGAEKNALLESASIYVLPSYAEGLPVGMLEAMAYGVPVVVTGVGGIPDTIRDGENGIIVQPGDIEGLTAGLERLISSMDLRVAIGRAGRATAQQFSTDHILSQLAEITGSVFKAGTDWRAIEERPKRIMICGPIKPPVGGVSIHIARLMERLTETRDFVFSVCDESNVRKDGIFNLRSLRLREYVGLIRHSDIVHVHSGVAIARAMHIVAGRLLGKRVVVTIHSWAKGKTATQIWRAIFWLLRPELIFVSEAIASRFNSNKNIVPAFIPANLDLEPDLPDALRNWIDSQRAKGKVIICSNAFRLATLDGEDLYGLDQCFEAMARIGGERAALVFVVSDPEFDRGRLCKAQDLIESLNLRSDIYLQEGSVSFVKLVAKSDINLRATLSDGDALSIRESLMLGKPTIASDAAKRPEGTVLYASRNREDLCNKLRQEMLGLKSTNARVSSQGDCRYADEIRKVYLKIANGRTDT